LMDHPDLTWEQVGDALDFAPIALMRKSKREAPSRDAAARNGLYRELRDIFPDGWDPAADFPRRLLGSQLFGLFPEVDRPHATRSTHASSAFRLAGSPSAWMTRSSPTPFVGCSTRRPRPQRANKNHDGANLLEEVTP